MGITSAPQPKNMNKEQLAEQVHLWYLEATKELHPESYNAKAQKAYADLTEEQKYMDRYMAEKILEGLKEERERTLEEERRFILNILDGIDIADKEAGIIGGTKAIRVALKSRTA